MAQEGFNSIKSKRMKDLVLKLDLMKAYDTVYWTFVFLLLLQIGLPLEITNWIMVCVSSANLIFLINGAHSSFFNFLRVLVQGCPLSLLLFLLVVEGLNKLIEKSKLDNKINGAKLQITSQLHTYYLWMMFCSFVKHQRWNGMFLKNFGVII